MTSIEWEGGGRYYIFASMRVQTLYLNCNHVTSRPSASLTFACVIYSECIFIFRPFPFPKVLATWLPLIKKACKKKNSSEYYLILSTIWLLMVQADVGWHPKEPSYSRWRKWVVAANPRARYERKIIIYYFLTGNLLTLVSDSLIKNGKGKSCCVFPSKNLFH